MNVEPFVLFRAEWLRDAPMFDRAGLPHRILPFALSGFVMMAGVLAGSGPTDAATMAVGAATAGLSVLLALVLPWGRLPRTAEVVPPVVAVVAIALFRYATGGHDSSLTVLSGVVVLWVALFGTPREVAIVLGAIAVSLVVPIVAVGGPLYPSTEYPGLVVLVATFALGSWILLSLTGAVRHYARNADAASRLLNEQARRDPLTGLLNRRGMAEVIDRELAEARRGGRPVSVVMLDLDRFKLLNDQFGHAAGDALLVRVADAFRAELRPRDAIARHGGEEFLALLPGTTGQAAVVVSDRLRFAMPNGQTCSAGVAEWDGAEEIDALIGRSDEALYAAKTAGRNATVLSRPDLAVRVEHGAA